MKIGRCWSPRCVAAACAFAMTSSTPAFAQNDALEEGDRVMATLGGRPLPVGEFIARCPAGLQIAGFDLAIVETEGIGGYRTELSFRAIQPICVRALAPAVAGRFEPHSQPTSRQVSSSIRLVCPGNTPVVTKMKVQVSYKSDAGRWNPFGQILSVNGIQLYCGLAHAMPSPHAEGPSYFGPLISGEQSIDGNSRCADGLVGVGISGQSPNGERVNALGLICGNPVVTLRPEPVVKAQGRVQLPPSSEPGPLSRMSICEKAQWARARNSPAAPGLEAQCEKSGEGAQPILKAQGRVVIPGAPVKKLPICDAARLARARNSPAAPGLEAQCKAAGEAVQPAQDEPIQPAQTAKVILGVDVFDAPGGAGNRTGALNADTIVGFVACQPDNWCHVNGNNVPNGDGWVYSGPDYQSLQI